MKSSFSALLCATALATAAFSACGAGKRTASLAASPQAPNHDRYVVVLSLDGFRADYQGRANTPNLDQMDKEGLSGRFRPSYPTLTFPNHYSMATGLYPNNHGLVGNEFWDNRGAHYRLGDRKAVADPSFYLGEPLWNVARRHGMKSASFFWVGSETAVGGHQPDRWKPFNDQVPYTDRADSIISWLQLPKPERPNLLMWYIEEPDHTGHNEGPESPKTLRMVEKMDSIVGYFRSKLAQLPIASQVDFILVADHGMQSFDKSRSVNLADYLPRDSFEHVATGPFTHLYPKAGYTETAYKILKKIPHIQVYRKGELPKRLHFGTSERIGELVLIADLGTQIFFRPDGLPKHFMHAGHGFDNKHPEMYAVFKAVGPDFQAGRHISRPIPNITLYPLVCQILGLQPGANDADARLAHSLRKTAK